MEQRPVGIVMALLGAFGTAIAALADPLGIGEGHVFGWLQITGVVLGVIVTLIGLALAMEWVPNRRRSSSTSVAGGGQNTTIVSNPAPRDRTAP